MRFASRLVAAVILAMFLASCCVIQRLFAVNGPLLVPVQQINRTNANIRIQPTFHVINNSVYALYAIRDDRNGNMGERRLRLLVVTKEKTNYTCRFPGGTVVEADESYEMSENHGMPFGVYFVNCATPSNETVGGSIEFSHQNSPWVTLPITYNIPDESTIKHHKYQFTICLPFIFGDRYSGKSLVEFVELNRILGVEHVVAYLSTNQTEIPISLSNAIKFYANMRILEVVHLNIPIDPLKIWYHGQLVAITDCLYRNMGVSRFVAFHDMDEFLIPQKPELLPKTSPLLSLLSQILIDDVASVRVHTQYFDLRYNGELMTLKNIIRRKYTDKALTKCVVRPEMIFEQGIHHTSRVIKDLYKTIHGDESVLRLYHFQTRGGTQADMRIVKEYGRQLKQRYGRIVAQIGL